MPAQNEEVLFQEEQSFRQLWLWVILPLILLVQLSSFTFLLVNAPHDAKTLPAAIGLGVGILVVVCAIYFLSSITLSVMVDGEYLHVRFVPLVKKDIRLDEIAHWEPRTYRPLLEYGGW